MRAENKQSRPDELLANVRPIEFLTENGFSIVRQWEAEQKPPPADGIYAFIVRDPQDKERQIIVSIATNLVARAQFRATARVEPDSDYWIYCAERHLATHLWEKDDFPINNKL